MALTGVQEVRALDFDLGARRLEAVHVGPPGTILAALAPLAMGASSAALLRSQWNAVPTTRRVSLGRLRNQRRALWLGAHDQCVHVRWSSSVAGLVAESTGLVADSLDMLADASIYAIALLAAGNLASQRRSARASGWLHSMLAASSSSR